MADRFENHAQKKSDPPPRGFVISPDDAADLPYVTTCLNVAASGTVWVTTSGGDTIPYYVAAGIQFPCRARRVWATGTTATGIVGSF